MATPSKDDSAVKLLIDGKVHAEWTSYEVDSDLLIPADAWRVTLSLGDAILPVAIVPGKAFELRVGDDPVMVGRIDEVGCDIAKDGAHFEISGRDGAAVLLDCSTPIFVKQQATLLEIVVMITRELGITQCEIRGGGGRTKEKINVEPGENAWETLTNAAEANGLWPWFEPDGTLVVGGPDYTARPVATLIMERHGRGNNVLRLSQHTSIQGRYSEVTILGQKRGTSSEQGKHAIKATEFDRGVRWHRPKIMFDYEADSEAVARTRARKLLSDSRLKGYSLIAQVQGHRIVADGQPSDGLLWTPGQRVRVECHQLGINGTYFLMARKFTGGRDSGPRTQLTLKEDKAWVLDAHPHKKDYRLGKNAAPLQILDYPKGAGQK